MNWKKFDKYNHLSIFGAGFMFTVAAWNITKSEPQYWWALVDFIIGCFNLFALYIGLKNRGEI